MKKIAFITGILGQDGLYLSEFLLGKGYEVYGLDKLAVSDNRKLPNGFLDRIELITGDLLDGKLLTKILQDIRPDEVYNLAAQSSPAESWKDPTHTGEITGLAVIRLLETIYQVDSKIRFFQASSSEIFGKAEKFPQNEETPPHPSNPYGIAKLYAYWATVNYREAYRLHACNGILFNHESPRRGLKFVTRKITNTVAKIKLGTAKELVLGNLDAKRDWGFAGDYIEAMWLMLQHEDPNDYVIATGETHSVREFVEIAFKHVSLDWKKYVRVGSKFLRPAEPFLLIGDATKAKKELGWQPKVDFAGLVKMMVDFDLSLLSEK